MLVTNARRDPTRTAMLRDEYVKACRRRFVKIKRVINTTIVDNDALRLANPGSPLGILSVHATAAGRYAFPSDPAGKVKAFMDWLNEMVDQDMLEVTQRSGQRIAQRAEWQNTYVRAAYGKGMTQADTRLQQAGINLPEYSLNAAFGQPMHANTLALLFTRNFNELKGITDAMGAQIARTLAEGLSQGLGPRAIARMITDRVDGIGLYRATVMARTEVIRAFTESVLNRYEEMGLDSVQGQAELMTAGDGRVCDICASLEGHVYSIAEARGIIPIHPQCRCTWLPVIVSTNKARYYYKKQYSFSVN